MSESRSATAPGRGVSPLRAAATERGENLADLAKATGYSHSTIGQVSRGHVAPWPELRRRMTGHFGFDPFDDGAA